MAETVEEIKARIGSASMDELNALLGDERVQVQKAAQDEIDARNAATAPAPITEYDPRTDPGPERYEDQFVAEDDTPLSAPERTDEESRRDETTVMANDRLIVTDENEVQIKND